MLTSAGICVWAQFIFCYPDQTEDDRRQTVELMKRLNGVSPPGLVRHFWYRFMVHHGVEELFRERYEVRAETPANWSSPLYHPERVERIHEFYRGRLPENAELYI